MIFKSKPARFVVLSFQLKRIFIFPHLQECSKFVAYLSTMEHVFLSNEIGVWWIAMRYSMNIFFFKYGPIIFTLSIWRIWLLKFCEEKKKHRSRANNQTRMDKEKMSNNSSSACLPIINVFPTANHWIVLIGSSKFLCIQINYMSILLNVLLALQFVCFFSLLPTFITLKKQNNSWMNV